MGQPPSPRTGATAVYDPVGQRMIVFGGQGPQDAGFARLNDLWALSLAPGGPAVWTELAPAGPLPPARSNHAAALDPVSATMVIQGGDSGGKVLSDTWLLSLSDAGAPRWSSLADTSLGAQIFASATSDGLGNVLLLGGVMGSNMTAQGPYFLVPAGAGGWQQVPTVGVAPSTRDYAMFVSVEAQQFWLFAGRDSITAFLDDAWVLDRPAVGPASWQLVVTSGSKPSPRLAARGIYDRVGQRMVVYGGFAGTGTGGVLGDTWVLDCH
jgi:hypothetical protein